MTEARKINRLRSLTRRIERASGKKKAFLKREYDLTHRSLGRVTWVSAPPLYAKDWNYHVDGIRQAGKTKQL